MKEISFVLVISIFTLSLGTQASEYNIFEGLECRGGPALVLSQGQVVFEEGKLQVQQGTGRFIPRKHFPDHAYQRVNFRNQVQCSYDSKAISVVILKCYFTFHVSITVRH